MSTFTKYLSETDVAWFVHWTATATAADDTDTLLVDFSGLSNTPLHLSVTYFRLHTNDTDVITTIEWDQTADAQILVQNQGATETINLFDVTCHPTDGIVNPKGTGTTGDIFLTTSGIGASSTLDITIAGKKLFV